MVDYEKLPGNESILERFKKGQVIIKEGEDKCEKMYILLKGTADIYKNYQEFGEIKIATLKEGDYFGEMSLFLRKSRTATVVANDNVTALAIDNINVYNFFVNQPKTAYSLIKSLCSRLDSTNTSMADNYVKYEKSINSLYHEKSELEVAANIDELTGVYNRRYFINIAESQINDLRKKNKTAFIAMLDLDHFKRINDTYGHPAGDIVLKRVAECIQHSIRTVDLFARYGGEEFILLIANISKETVQELIERIRQNIRNEFIGFEGTRIPVTASIGIASVLPGSDLSEAVSFADEALYRAKNEGRDRVVFY